MSHYTNINQIFKKANIVEIVEGLVWYGEAHKYALELSEKYGVELEKVVGVISALSPRCTWELNCRDAERVIAYHVGSLQRSFNGGFPVVTTYGQNLRKAIDILRYGVSPDTFKAPKTYNFYHNILNPNSNDHVTIDGHAINIAKGSLGSVDNKDFTPKYYNNIASAYKKLANKTGLKAHQVQAICWMAYKRINNIKVNWRYYQAELPF